MATSAVTSSPTDFSNCNMAETVMDAGQTAWLGLHVERADLSYFPS